MRYVFGMSTTAQVILEQLKKLPDSDRQEVLRELLRSLPNTPGDLLCELPSVQVSGGTITSEQVAEALEQG